MTAATLPNRNGTHRKDNRLHKRHGNLMLKRLTALLLLSVATFAPMPAVSQTDPCDGALDWTGITPDCLSPGDPYRILFVTSNTRDAQSGNIADYNTFVQNAADGVTGTPFASITFRVLGSTSAVNARDNTGTTGAGTGIRTFYYQGRKVADSYTDLYDGTWDTNEPRHQDGMVRAAGGGFDAFILTGTNNDGNTGATLGTPTGVGTGDSQTTGSPLSNANRTGPGASQSFYGLSEVLTPPSNPAFDGAASIDPQVYTVGTPITTLPLPEAANGNGVLTYTIAPTLPDGLTLGGANGNVLSGTPELGTERTITDYTYMVSDADANTDPIDTDTIDFTITVNAATTPTIFGDLIGFIAEDAILNTISGTVRIAAASGTTMFTAQTAADSTYGSFTLTPDPSNDDRATWTYTLDNDNSAVNALASETDTLTDTFTIAAAGVTDDANVTITITGADDAPTAVIAEGPTLTVDLGDTVTLTSTGSNDPESAIASYRWRVVANGNPSLSLGASSTRSNTISFTAPSVDTTDDYTIGLIVNDGTVNSAEATIIVTVVNPAIPSITIAADTSPVTEGTAAAFTLTADPAPGTDLIVTVTVTDSGNFIAGAAPTTVTITASETTAMLEIPTMADVIDEANGMITATVETGTDYTVGTDDTASVTVDDDDTANVTVSETTRTVAENGGTMTYTIMLDTEPTDDVTITPASSDTDVAIVSGALTFTTANWNTAQTVTVTGVNDDIPNPGDRTATVSHTAASVADSIYEGLDVANVVVTATDDDAAPGPTITIAADTASVTEGTAAEFTLTASPVAPIGGLTVTVSVTETGMFIAGAPPPTVTIAASAATATLTVATTDDNIDEIDGAVMALLTSGVGYTVGSSSSTASVAVNNDDDANVAVSVTTLTVAENGGTMTYTIMLDTEPTDDVTITPESDATLVATVSSALTFTPTNWNTAQTVTVTGVDDDGPGARTATVSHTPASADDSIYEGLTVANVVVTATDDDGASALLEAVSPTTLGARRLNSSTNRATVTVTLMNTVYVDTAELSGDDFMLSDTVDGEVTVESAVTRDSATVATLTLGHIGGISNDGTVSVTVLDSAHTGTGDLPAVSLPIDATAPTVSTVAFSTTGPYGLGDNIEVTITFSENVFVEGTNPNALLIIGISANQAAPYLSGEGSNTLVFRRTVGAGDNDADGVDIQSRTLLGGGGLIRDAAGNNVVRNPSHGQVNGGTDQRIDPSMGASPSITIAADTSPVTEGTAAAFTLTADPAPAGDLTITVSVSQTGTFIEGVAPTTVTIAAAATTAALMVATTDDDIDEAAGEVTATVEDGTDYTVGTGNTASVTVNDDDTAGVTVDPLALTVDEAGSGTTADYTLVLDTVPTADVTIAVASDTDTAATVSSASLTFTPANWNTAQTVTVTGVNDDVPGDRTATVTHTATSADGNYEGAAINIASVTVTVTDDDAVAAGVTVDPMTLSVLEADGTADYTLVLDTAPTADVTIAVASDTVTAATVSSASLTFTPANWNTAQTVTVTGVNDDVDNPSDERTASLSHTAASADGDYDGGAITIASVTVTVTDDDDAGVTVDPMALTVDEADGTGTYTLVLDTVPTADVTIAVASDTDTAATVSSASLTFTPANWNTAQTVTVTGVDDSDVNTPDRTATVTHTATSTDGDYNTVPIANVVVTATDDDGVVVPSALLAAADPTTLGERRLNSSTNRATVTVTLMGTVYEPSADLTAADFMLSDTVDGEVTVNSVTRDSDTAATLALAHTGAISSDGTVSVTVLDSAHTGAGNLDAGSLPIDATAPTVVANGVAFGTTGPYGLGANIEVTITFSENVFVNATTPNANLTVVSSGFVAAYNRGDGTSELVFRRTVVTGDDDADGADIQRDALFGGGGIIRDAAGNDAVRTGTNSRIDGGATHRVDATLPMLSTATVDGATLTLTYDEALGASTPANGDYVVMAGSSSVTVSDVTLSGMAVTLTLTTPVTAGQTVTLDYTPGSAPVQDTVGNDAVMLDDRTVMNNTSGVVPSITIAAGTSPVTEGTAAEFTLTASSAAPVGGLTVTVSVTQTGTFIEGPPPTTVTIAAAAETATLTVATTDDNTDEAAGSVTATVTAGSGYMVGTGNTASVTVNDDDAAPTLAIDSPSVAEGDAGETPTLSYTVTLTGATEQEVTVDYADTTSGTATSGTDYETITAGTLTFAPGTTTQSIDVTVTGDADDEGDETVILRLSGETNATITTADGTGTITDDDGAPVAGVTVTPATLSVPEDGSTPADYTLVLDTAPTADVTIAVASDTVTAATVSSASLTFTPTNWNTAQTVTVTGVNDDVPAARTATVTHTAASTDGNYEGAAISIASVTVTVEDDDAAPTVVDTVAITSTGPYGVNGNIDVTVTFSEAVTVTGTPLITLTVGSAPQLAFYDSGSGTTALLFRYTVAAGDNDADGVSIAADALALNGGTIRDSADSNASITHGAVVAAVDQVVDTTAPGVTVDPTTLSVLEASGTGTYTLVLDTAPTADVTIAVASNTTSTATVSPTSLTFSTTDWDTAQTVTVTGVNDSDVNTPDRTATVTHTATSTDGNYEGAAISIASVTVTVEDDDAVAVAGVTVTPATLSVPEDGGSTADYTLVLDTAPTADVTIAVASDTVTAATVSSASLTFTPANWNTAQTVTVTGVNDDVDNPSDERTATVSHVPTSADAGYTSVVIASVTVTVTDDDDAGVTVDPLALMVPEASGTSTYTVVLDTQPIGNVTITPESGDTMTATVSGALTFTTTDWSTAQTVTVTGVDDSDVNTPARTATVSHTPASADDPIYAGLTIASVVVTATDDDGVAVPSALLTADTPLGERDLRRSTTNTVTVMVTLMNTMYVPEADLDMSDFTLTDDVAGVVTVSMVTRTSDRVATLRLTHGGEDIASDGELSVTVLATAHTGTEILDAGSVPIDATAPTVAVNGVGFSTTGPYGLGGNIEVTVIFRENVFVEETTPNALLDIGSRASVAAAYNRGSGSNTLVFRYTVVAGDDAPAPPGAQIRSSTLSLGGGIIRDAAGNDAVRTGTNTSINGGINQRVDAALPMLSTATVDGTALTLTYNEALDDTSTTLPSTADYTVTVGTASRDVSGVTISGMTVTLTLATAVTGGQVVILDYTPGTNPVRDTVGNNAAPLDDQAVTTIGGTVAVTLDTIAGDNIVNILEKAAGFPISGTMDSAATEVSVTIGTGMARAAILDSSSATWTIAISADDADITGTSVNVVVTAMLAGGGATGTVSRPLTVDLVPPVPPAAMTYTPPPALTVGTTITDIVPSTTATDIASYLVFGGTLPPGLTLASDTGVISGAPTTVNVATATVDIILRDGAGNPATVQIIFPAVGIGSQTLTGFAYTPATVALNAPTPPTVMPPSGAQTPLNYITTTPAVCTVDRDTGALTLLSAGDCVITVTATPTSNYNEATADFTITVSLPAAGVTVTPTELTVPEDGTTTGTYTLVLDTAPTADVTIAVASDTVTAATVSSASLTFTPTNWNTAQTVTVTGVNDDVDNPSDERTATVTHVPTSADAGYTSVVIDSVTVTVTDDDAAAAGITFDPLALTVDEAGSNTYTVVLDTAPTAEVTIAVVSGGDTSATVSPPSLTFTTTNWNTAQTVTVAGVNNNVDFVSDIVIGVTHTGTSADSNYEGVSRTLVVTVTDDDTADVTVSETTRTVAENGGTDTYTVVLNTVPTDNVTITPASSDTDVAIVSAALTFTLTTWDTPQTVTVTGVNDNIDNPPSDERTATVTHTPASTGDSLYAGLTIASVTVTVEDDDDLISGTVAVSLDTISGDDIVNIAERAAGFTISGTMASGATGVSVTIGTGMARTATLNASSATWTIDISGGDADITGTSVDVVVTATMGADTGTVTRSLTVDLVLPTATYAAPPALTVGTAITDIMPGSPSADIASYAVQSGTLPPGLTLASDTGVISGAPTTANAATATVDIRLTDGAGNPTDVEIIFPAVSSPTAGVTVDPMALTVPEDGSSTGAYTLVLNTMPSADVTITVASSDTLAATVSSETLTFTTTDWNTAQTVTVTGVSDTAPGDRTVTLSHTAASTDSNYNGVAITIASVTVTVDNDDAAAGVTVTPTTLTVSEDGSALDTYTLVLDTMPSADVTITVASSDTLAATVSSASLTFTPTNWNTAQTVTVTGVNDTALGDRTVTLSHTAASTDSNYNGGAITIASVTVTVTDDDAGPNFTFTETGGTTIVAEMGGTDTYTVELATQPTADVTIAVVSGNDAAATVSPPSLTFTTANWNVAQTVTVTGVNDDIDFQFDLELAVSHTGTSADSTYEGLSRDVFVTQTDNDTADVTVSETTRTVAENSGTATYTVVLDTEPFGNVTITPASSDPDVAIVSGALTFTQSNWNTAQTVTVTGVDDSDVNTPARTATVSHTPASADDSTYGGLTITSVVVTATDDDGGPALPSISIAAVSSSVTEGAAATFTLTATPAPAANLTVTVTVTETGTFISGAAPTTVTIPSSGSVTLTVLTTDDATDEANGMITATVMAGTGYTVGSPPTASVTVEDNDPAPVTPDPAITIAAVSSSVTEGAAATFTLTATPAPAANLTVTVTVTETGTFINGAAPTTVTIPSSGSVTLAVPTTDDATDEANGMITATVTAGSGYTVGSPPTASVTVEDNDGVPVTPDPERIDPELTEQLQEEIASQAVQTVAANVVASVGTRIETTIRGAPPIGGVQLDGKPGLLGFLDNLPEYGKSIQEGSTDWKRRLANSSFSLNVAGDGGADGGLGLWGSGHYTEFDGDDDDLDWDGDSYGFQVGVDTRWGANLLTGISVSWSEGDVEYTQGSGADAARGDYTLTLTGLHPYMGWSNDSGSLSLWASAGYADGKVEIEPDEGRRQEYDASVVSVAGGFTRSLTGSLSIKGDFSALEADIDEEDEVANGRDFSLDSQRARLLLEGRHQQRFRNGGILTQSIEAGYRLDEGDSDADTDGAEVGGSLDYQNPATGLTLSGKVRGLVGNSDYREWGISGLIRLESGTQGLSFTLEPGYGDTAGSAGELWQRRQAPTLETERQSYGGRMKMHLGYGLHGGVMPYTEVTSGEALRSFRMGVKWQLGKALDLNLFGEQYEADESDHSLQLEGKLEF